MTTICWIRYFITGILIIADRPKSVASYKGLNGGHFLDSCVHLSRISCAANDVLDASSLLADENYLHFYLEQQALAM